MEAQMEDAVTAAVGRAWYRDVMCFRQPQPCDAITR